MCNEDMRIKLDKSATLPNQLESTQPSKKKASEENKHRGTKNFKNQSKLLDQEEQIMPQRNKRNETNQNGRKRTCLQAGAKMPNKKRP